MECTSGLRNLNRSVARSPSLQKTGKRLRRILEDLMTSERIKAAARAAVDAIGNRVCGGMLNDVLKAARGKFHIAFKLKEEVNPGAICRLSQGASMPRGFATCRNFISPRSASFSWAWPRDLFEARLIAALGIMGRGA